MDGVLTKPVSVDELRALLEKTGGRRKREIGAGEIAGPQ
jgi:hypothetical protein